MLTRMQGRVVMAAAAVSLAALGCDEGSQSPTQPGSAIASARIVFAGATARRSDLPLSAQACVNGVGATHIHPSWRKALPPSR